MVAVNSLFERGAMPFLTSRVARICANKKLLVIGATRLKLISSFDYVEQLL